MERQHQSDDAEQLFGGHFHVIRRLRATGSIETWQGTDQRTLEDVIVTVVPNADLRSGTRAQLEHAVQALASDESRHLIAPMECGRDGSFLYVARPFTKGMTLAKRLSVRRLEVHEVIALGIRVLRGIGAVHEKGLLHRDVTPMNVMLAPNGDVSTARVVFEAPTWSSIRDLSVQRLPVATARYVSPEIAGLFDRSAGAHSDLYSFGILLFECLAGRPPFDARETPSLLRQHLASKPAALHALNRDIPPTLDDIVQRLLRKEPSERYQSVEGVIRDLQSVMHVEEQEVVDAPVVIGAHDRRLTLTDPAFIGREQEMQNLEAQLDRAQEGHGGLVLLEAISGGGKSTLLDRIEVRAKARGFSVLRGHAEANSAQRPFQILTEMANGLMEMAAEQPMAAARIRNLMGHHAQVISEALPALGALLVDHEAHVGLGPEALGQVRSLRALGTLLDALGAFGQPTVLLLDDVQWADELSLRLLSHWAAAHTNQQRRVLIVAAFRTDEVDDDNVLRRVQLASHVELQPFDAIETRQLAESMAGILPDDALDAVSTLSAGNPFMVSAVLRGMVESGALRADASGWQIDRDALGEAQSSRQAAMVLAGRLQRLASDTLDMVRIGAVLGKQFDLELLAQLTQRSSVGSPGTELEFAL